MNDTDERTAPPGGGGDPSTPPDVARPPLRRRQDDRVLAGVASGLAAHLNVDPALMRIGFVVLLFAGGIGLPLYVAGWLLIPEADEEEIAAQQLVRSKGPGFWVGIAILVAIAVAVAGELPFGGGNLWPLVFIAAGIALWRASQDETRRPRRDDAEPTGTASGPATSASAAAPPARPVRRPVEFTPPPVPQRKSAVLGRVTLALALIAAGVTVLLDRAGAVDAALTHVLAVPLTVLGLGLVVGAWFGRGRILIFPALVLAPVVIVTALFHAIGVPVEAGFAERIHEVSSASQVDADGYRLAGGQLVLHLEELGDEREPIEVRAELGAGELEVRVPPDAEVRVTASLGFGELVLFDRTVTAAGIEESVVREGSPGGPVILLDLRAGVGQILVRDGHPAPTTEEPTP